MDVDKKDLKEEELTDEEMERFKKLLEVINSRFDHECIDDKKKRSQDNFQNRNGKFWR